MQLIATRILQRYGLILPSIALFAVCLANDGYYIDGPDPRAWASAWGLLFFGWVGVLSGTVAWLANPVMFLAWIMFHSRHYRAATLFAVIAVVLILSFLLTKTVVSSESPTYSKVVGYGLGYWFWLASAVALLIGSLIESVRSKRKAAESSSLTGTGIY
jgi:hypothetical protein